eukprot:gene13611-15661_t
MYFSVGYCVVVEEFPKQIGDQLDVGEVRRTASEIVNIKEIGINEASKVISFQAVDSGWKINVYYTTGTVGTCVEHPISGKTQLFRRKVSYETLQRIFQNPRVHTGKGYYTVPTGKPGSSAAISPAEDEETALTNQIAILRPQLELMEDQLASIRQKRLKEEQERLKKAEAVREAKEEKARAAAAAEQLRLENIARQEAKERLAASNRLNSLRGACFDYSLQHSTHFPTSMKDVKCVAICDGGYVAVMDSGSCCWHGIPSDVINVLKRQQNHMIDYIALGPEQYYIRKTNGKILYRGCEEFEEEIGNNSDEIKFVTFGDENTFYLEYEDGTVRYSDSLAYKIPSHAFENLTSRRVSHFYLGQGSDSYSYYSNDQPYCITYENGTCDYDNLPSELNEWFEEEKKPGNKTQLFRRKVDYETLQRIFTNPRVHTGKGYYTVPVTGLKRNASEILYLEEDEETALSNQIDVLKPQLELMEQQLASIRQKRVEEAQKKAREEEKLTRKQEERLAEEERVRAAAAAEQLRLENIARQEAKERLAASNRLNSLRGACFDYSLRHDTHFPTSMKDVKCIALSNGGYVALYDHGRCGWHGIPSDVAEVLKRQQNRMIDYIALGPGQYYIRKTNGKVFFRGCGAFEEEIRKQNGVVKFVTFGDQNTYFLEYESGLTSYNSSFVVLIHPHVLEKLTSRPVRHFFLDQSPFFYFAVPWNRAYCVTYEDGSCDYGNLPVQLNEWFEEEKEPGNKVKQVLADPTGSFFVRYA